MCVSVCRIYLLLCFTYLILLLINQNTLSQKLRPSKRHDSVTQMDPPSSAYKSTGNSKQKRVPRSLWTRKEDSRRNMGASCRDKCGQPFDLPCSCDIQCLVYKNCCENFYLECPEMIPEAESVYTPELLNSQIECIHNGMLAISSCPNASSLDTVNLSSSWINEYREKMSQLQAALSGKEPLTSAEVDSQTGEQSAKHGQSVIHVLSNIPVSDISTGLLYKTPEIFACNIGRESVAGLWTIEIAISKILSGLQHIQHLTVKKDEVKYIPPSQLPADSVYRLCVPRSIGTCKHPQDKCETFLSYVYESPKLRLVYNNKYCALCNGLEEENIRSFMKYDGIRTDFSLSVTMSLSNDKLKLSTVGRGNLKKVIPWSEAECNLSNDRQMVEHEKISACQIDSCGNENVMRPDGTCKSLREFQVAFSDHGHTPFLASVVDLGNGQVLKEEESRKKMTVGGPLGALPDLVRCTLETHYGYDLGEKVYPLMIRRDHRLNATLFVVDIQLYLTLEESIYEQNLMDVSTSAMALIAKSLFWYNKTWYLTQKGKFASHPHSYNKSFFEEIETVGGESYTYRDSLSFQVQNCSEKLDNFTICVCNEVQAQIFRNKRCQLLCFEDSLCKNQVKEARAFSESKCFSQIRSLASHGTCCALMKSTHLLLLIVLVIIMH